MGLEAPLTRGGVKPFQCQLDTFELTRESAQRVLEQVVAGRIDGLFLCAGRTPQEGGTFEVGEDGIEMLIQVNYFSTVLFTQTLLPTLIKTSKATDSDVRIVLVASAASAMAPNYWTSFVNPDKSSLSRSL